MPPRGANWPAGRLVTGQLPSPLEKATGMVLQPATPVTARSVRPLPLKAPVTTFAPGDAAQGGELAGGQVGDRPVTVAVGEGNRDGAPARHPGHREVGAAVAVEVTGHDLRPRRCRPGGRTGRRAGW